MLRILSALTTLVAVTNCVSVAQSSNYKQKFIDSLSEVTSSASPSAPAFNC
jgi:hypothetical protein